MTGEEKAIVQKNKSIRGWIIRSLAKGYNNEAMCRSIVNALMAEGMIISPDIGKHLDYLQDAGYIEFSNKKVTAYRAFAEDTVVRLTRKGVDLVEGTVEDPGVDI